MPLPTPDLVFDLLPIGGSPTPLLFGETYGPPPVEVNVAFQLGGVEVNAFLGPPVEADIAFQLGGVDVAAFVGTPVRTEIAFTLGGVTVAAGAFYDNRVLPMLDCRVKSPMAPGVPVDVGTDSPWGLSKETRQGTDTRWDVADLQKTESVAVHQRALENRALTDTGWDVADGAHTSKDSVHQQAVHHHRGGATHWQVGDYLEYRSGSGFQAGIFHQLDMVSRFQSGRPSYIGRTGLMGASLHYNGISFFLSPWGMAGWPVPGTVTPPVIPPEPPGPVPPSPHLLFECPPLLLPYLVFGGMSPCDIIIPPPGPGPNTVVVPVRRIYMILNDARLRRVEGNIQLPTLSMSLSLDIGSWTWRFSASLPASTLSNLEPSSTGAPVELEALINGVAYRALVDDISRDRSFGSSAISITGRGKTALLDDPYSPVMQFGNSSSRTAAQLMGDILTVNEVPMAWTIDFGLTDWLVGAGLFSHTGTYISALKAVAGAAGGYLQPHPSTQTIKVLPKYPSTPWSWASTVVPDYILPSDVTVREGIGWAERARYNRVYVSGQQAGILGQVTITGTDGGILAPMQVDPLITTVEVATQRGLSILGGTGRVANISLSLPVLPETGIIPPGKFVRYTDNGVIRIGIVRSVGVQVGRPSISQTIQVESYVN